MIPEHGSLADFKRCVLDRVTTLACLNCGEPYICEQSTAMLLTCHKCTPQEQSILVSQNDPGIWNIDRI